MFDFCSRSLRLAPLAAWLGLALAGAVLAQAQAPPSSPAPAAPATVAAAAEPGSPRASLQAYLDACRRGDFKTAAAYLDASGLEDRPASDIARRLKQVLDRHLWFDLDKVSPRPEGDSADGLPPARERLGIMALATGEAMVDMTRQENAPTPGWVFAADTVNQVDAWFSGLDSHWLRDRLPAVLLRPGPLELQWWQWIALPALFLAALVMGRLLIAVLAALLAPLARRTRSDLDDIMLSRFQGPGSLFLTLASLWPLLEALGLPVPAHALVLGLVRAAFLAGLFWLVSRGLDVARLALDRSTWMEQHDSLRPVLPLVGRGGRMAVLAVGSISILQEFGFQVTGLLAGVGLAGMAVAFAAQKSIENLLGSAILLADRPFRVGDTVRVEDQIGTVERIGLRSTRIRTLDRTMVTYPNGRLSDMRLETLAERDRIRIFTVLGLTYSTRAAQMSAVGVALEEVLLLHPRIAAEPCRVRFVGFSASSLDLEVLAYVETTDWAEYLGVRQEIYLRFMEVVEAHGCSFAFPTRTVHLAPGAGVPRAGSSALDGSTATGASQA